MNNIQPDNKMKPEQAIKILEDATGHLKLSRLEHSVIIQALDVVRKLIPQQDKKS